MAKSPKHVLEDFKVKPPGSVKDLLNSGALDLGLGMATRMAMQKVMTPAPKTTARLILFFDCPRRCIGCCNEHEALRAQMQKVDSLDALESYEEIIVTGGEPMYRAADTVEFIQRLRRRFPDKTVYLYTALFSHRMRELAELIDGVHYTIHDGPNMLDAVNGFSLAQREFELNPAWAGKSIRLYIDNRVAVRIAVLPRVWSRVEIKPWLNEGNCPLPAHEDLLVWDGDLV